MKKVAKKVIKHKRPSWDEYFFKIVDSVGSRATCDRGGKGCVITLNNRILSTGYLGSVSGLPHCDKIGHDIENDGNCRRTIHAEHNAITQALNYGAPLEGATIYCEIEPCSSCAGMIASLGIKKIISKNSKK